MISNFVLFGATGDLAGRFILPALAELAHDNLLPEDFVLSAFSDSSLDNAGFHVHMSQRLKRFAAHLPDTAHVWVLNRCHYQSGDATRANDVQRLLARHGHNPVMNYLALPTNTMIKTLRALAAAEMSPGSRIALEKPFGNDLNSATDLASILTDLFGDQGPDTIFNVDHALGRPLVQAMPALRLANPMLEAVWNSDYIEEFRVVWEETIALEGRAEFYDRTGALKDVLQNHLMQVLTMSTMEPTLGQCSPQLLQQHKLELLQSVRIPSVSEVVQTSRRGRYTVGAVAGDPAGQWVPDYVAEPGVDASRNTETFAEVVLQIENPRWAGTLFRLRTAKALAAQRKGIEILFRSMDETVPGTTLWIGLNGPNTLELKLNTIGTDNELEVVQLTGNQPEAEFGAYANVLKNCLDGGTDLSVSMDEALLSWQILTPFVDAWSRGAVPLESYTAGQPIPYFR